MSIQHFHNKFIKKYFILSSFQRSINKLNTFSTRNQRFYFDWVPENEQINNIAINYLTQMLTSSAKLVINLINKIILHNQGVGGSRDRSMPPGNSIFNLTLFYNKLF